MRSQYFRFAVLLVATLTLGGCAAALQGYPDRVADTKAELAALEPFMKMEKIGEYEAATDDKKKAAYTRRIRQCTDFRHQPSLR